MNGAPVKVTRHPFPADAPWRVVCTICADGGPFAELFGGGVVIHARHDAWAQAMWWARWHVAEHQRTACPTCAHMPPLEPTTVLDDNTVKVGGRLFVRAGLGWKEAA